MTEDDWSLKGKQIHAGFDYDAGIVLNDEEFHDIHLGSEGGMDFFPIEIIETLRQKLIEDFIKEINERDSLDRHGCHYYHRQHRYIESSNPEETVKKIINKRFGV